MNLLRRLTLRDAVEGGRIPPFWGIAWRDFLTDHAVLMPIPLNLFARALRCAWVASVRLWPTTRREHWHRALVQKAYRRGYEDGLMHRHSLVCGAVPKKHLADDN